MYAQYRRARRAPPKVVRVSSSLSARRARFKARAIINRKEALSLSRFPMKPIRNLNLRTGGFMGKELKYLDVYASQKALAAPTDCTGGEIQPEGGCTDCLSAPAQGDGATNRDGKRIIVKSIFVTGFVHCFPLQDQADVTTPTHIYIALVADTQTNGATIVSEQVFTNPNDTASVNVKPLRNLEYSSRYRILDQKYVYLGPMVASTDGANTTTTVGSGKRFQLAWRGNMPVNFGSGATADVANVTDNSIHIIAFATKITEQPQISFNSRLRFIG